MANQEYPVLDGNAVSWADIVVKSEIFDGPLVDVKDIAALNTSGTVEIGEQRGASGGRVTRRTTGQVSYEASMTLYASGWQTMLANLSSVAPDRGNQKVISLVHFNLQVQWTPEGATEIQEKIIKGCRVTGVTRNGAEGTDADQVEVALNPIEIVDVIDGVEHVML